MMFTTQLINDAPIAEEQVDNESSIDSISKLMEFGEPEVNISPKPISKAKYLQSEEVDFYYYFVLKNGARITAFRTPKANVGEVSNFINDSLKIYPEGSEIYQINFDEYFDIRRTVRELRRTFQRIRKRNIQYKDDIE